MKKLYIGGVKDPIGEIDIREYFSRFGSIADIVLMKDRDGQHRGYVNSINLNENSFFFAFSLDMLLWNSMSESRIVILRKLVLFVSYDPVDKVILEKNHHICGQPVDVQKAQPRDGSQRSGNMRSRAGPSSSSSMSRSNYNSGYNNYQQNDYNGQYGQMPNNDYNGYGSNFNDGNGNWTSFGQGFVRYFLRWKRLKYYLFV